MMERELLIQVVTTVYPADVLAWFKERNAKALVMDEEETPPGMVVLIDTDYMGWCDNKQTSVDGFVVEHELLWPSIIFDEFIDTYGNGVGEITYWVSPTDYASVGCEDCTPVIPLSMTLGKNEAERGKLEHLQRLYQFFDARVDAVETMFPTAMPVTV